ncbi:MAG: hypothetical protein RR238_04085 [Lachnospiraceae bacterium]
MSKERTYTTTNKNIIKKEDNNMTMVAKPNQATIINRDMLLAFIDELNANKPTKEYWSECEASNNLFSSSDIDEMKKMFDNGNI